MNLPYFLMSLLLFKIFCYNTMCGELHPLNTNMYQGLPTLPENEIELTPGAAADDPPTTI